METTTYQQFSTVPTLGHGEGSSDPRHEEYGALSFFIEGTEARTGALGEERSVAFAPTPGRVSVEEVAESTYQAAYLPGSRLNGAWGFVFNSGVPFGPDFSQKLDFLYEGGGVELANRILADRNVDVVAFPVVGSPAQVAG